MGGRALAALGAVAALGVLPAGASARTAGPETVSGVVVVAGGQDVASSVVAQGAFTGSGSVGHDGDLVFDAGTLHLVAGTQDRSSSFDPLTCVFNAVTRRTGTIAGGTGELAGATGRYDETVTAWGTLNRTADGSCAPDQPPLHEIDTLRVTGFLSY